MDELDHMYDDMQDRLYEIDKNRKVSVSFDKKMKEQDSTVNIAKRSSYTINIALK
jgi:hypothetical protein